MFDETDSALNSKSVHSNISYKEHLTKICAVMELCSTVRGHCQ